MSDTQVSKLRRRIGDRAKAQKEVATGNGTERSFNLQYRNVWGLIVAVDGTEKTLGADYTVDTDAGRVIFTVAPASGAAVTFDYQWGAFSDTELQDLIDTEGEASAPVAALEELLADTARFYDYTQDQTTSKRSQVFDHLLKMLEYHKGAAKKATNPAGFSTGVRTHRAYRNTIPLQTDLSRYDGP